MTPILKLVKNISSIFAAKAFDMFARLLTIAVIARYLGVEKYGEYAFVNTYVLFFIILSNLGVDEIVTREISIKHSRAESYLGGALSIRVFLLSGVAAIYAIMTIICNFDVVVVKAIYISLLGQAVMSLVNLFLSVMRGLERMEYEPITFLVFNLSYLILVLWIKNVDLGFIAIFKANVVAILFAIGVLAICVGRYISFSNVLLNVKKGKALLVDGYALGLSGFLLILLAQIDVFILNWLKGPVDVALFQLPNQLISRLSIIAISIIMGLFPVISRLCTLSGDQEHMKRAITQAYKAMIVLGCFLTLLIMIYAEDIIYLVGANAFSSAAKSFRILSLSMMFLFGDLLQSITLVALNKQRLLIIQNGVCLAINIVLDLIFVPHYGYLGASGVTVVAFAIRFFIGYYFVKQNTGEIRLLSMLVKCSLAAITPIVIVSYLFASREITKGVIATVCFGAIILLLKVFSRQDISYLRTSMKN